ALCARRDLPKPTPCRNRHPPALAMRCTASDARLPTAPAAHTTTTVPRESTFFSLCDPSMRLRQCRKQRYENRQIEKSRLRDRVCEIDGEPIGAAQHQQRSGRLITKERTRRRCGVLKIGKAHAMYDQLPPPDLAPNGQEDADHEPRNE